MARHAPTQKMNSMKYQVRMDLTVMDVDSVFEVGFSHDLLYPSQGLITYAD